MGISKRIFGSDILPKVKQKLALRQELNKTSNFGEAINMTEDSIVEAINMEEFNFVEGGNKIYADLSSRTPFARMWTGLSIFEDIKTPNDESFDTDAKVEKWWTDRAIGLADEGEKIKWENKYLKDMGGDVFEEHEWKRISNDYQRIYKPKI